MYFKSTFVTYDIVYQDAYFSTSDLCLSPAVLWLEPSNIHYKSYRELDYD